MLPSVRPCTHAKARSWITSKVHIAKKPIYVERYTIVFGITITAAIIALIAIIPPIAYLSVRKPDE